MWTCPVCNQPLQEKEYNYRCDNNHCFDKSKSGYVHLLPANRMHGKVPGDNKFMVDARRRFLSRDYYKPLAACIANCVVDFSSKGVLLDIGCGEGYYTGYVADKLEENQREISCYGVDISKVAIDRASRSWRNIHFSVGSAFHLPMGDGSCNCVLNLFAPYCGEEITRVLSRDGCFVMAIPGREHLWELKQALYDKPYKNEVKPFDLKGFNLVEKQELKYTMTLQDSQTIADLFAMTPYYYKTGKADQQKLERIESLSVTAHFFVLVYRGV